MPNQEENKDIQEKKTGWLQSSLQWFQQTYTQMKQNQFSKKYAHLVKGGTVDFYNDSIPDVQLEQHLMPFIAQHAITTLLLDTGVHVAQVIASAIQKPNCTLTSLHLNCLSELGSRKKEPFPVLEFSDAFRSNHCALINVTFDGVHFNDQEAAIFSQGLGVNRSILSLKFLVNRLTQRGIALILEAIKRKGNLNTLCFSYDYLDEQNIALVTSIITDPSCTLKSLTYAHLYGQNIGYITEAITHPHCKITALDLCDTHFDTKSISILAKMLEHPQCTLSTLKMHQQQLGPESITQLTEALQCNLTLMHFISKWGSQEPKVIALLQNNVHIQHLKILHEFFDNPSSNLILEYTCENLNPTMLHARMNGFVNQTKHLPPIPNCGPRNCK
jgi:hypothetical protein